MTTFADLMALMLTFFVLLLSMSTTDAKKYEQALMSIQEAFGKPMHGYLTGTGKIMGEGMSITPPVPVEEYLEKTAPQVTPTEPTKETIDATEKLYRDLSSALKEEIQSDAVEVHKFDDQVLLRFQETISFDLASAQLRNNFIPILNRVSQTLSGIDGSILVVGHTDDLPITTSRFRSNWDLSAARAASVVTHMLQDAKLPAERVIASGRADSIPLVPNDSAANRAKNRRVEIVVTMGDIARANYSPTKETEAPSGQPRPEAQAQ